MRRKMLVFAVLLSVSVLFAQPNEAALNQQYKSRILTLRHFFRSNSQNYDSSGNPIKAGKEGPWTLYGRFQVTDIKLHNDSVEVRGRRIGLVNENGCLSDYGVGKSPMYLPDPIGTVATIRIQLAPGETPESAMGNVFALTKQDLLASVPDLWKDYVRSRLDPQSHDGQWEFTPGQADEGTLSSPSNTPIVSIKTPGLIPPKAKYTPDPHYGGDIGSALVHGTDTIAAIIDEHGNPGSFRLLNPIGLGVDESSAEAMKNWKFEPARLNGTPVTVEMKIEQEYRGRNYRANK